MRTACVCVCVCLCTGVTLTIQWRDRNSPSLCEPYIAALPPHALNICKQWSQQHNNKNIYYKLSRHVSFIKTPTNRFVLANQTLNFTCMNKKLNSYIYQTRSLTSSLTSFLEIPIVLLLYNI